MCFITIVGHIKLTKGAETIIMGARCAKDEGLVFDKSGSSYPTLWQTEQALQGVKGYEAHKR